MSINAGVLQGSIMCPLRILLILLVTFIRVVSVCQTIIHQVDTMCLAGSKTSQEVGAFDVAMDILILMQEFQCFKLYK